MLVLGGLFAVMVGGALEMRADMQAETRAEAAALASPPDVAAPSMAKTRWMF
jgi:hypothetical protein